MFVCGEDSEVSSWARCCLLTSRIRTQVASLSSPCFDFISSLSSAIVGRSAVSSYRLHSVYCFHGKPGALIQGSITLYPHHITATLRVCERQRHCNKSSDLEGASLFSFCLLKYGCSKMQLARSCEQIQTSTVNA